VVHVADVLGEDGLRPGPGGDGGLLMPTGRQQRRQGMRTSEVLESGKGSGRSRAPAGTSRTSGEHSGDRVVDAADDRRS